VIGNPVEPVAQTFLVADSAGAARQHKEGGLEGVLGVVLVAEDAAAHAQDHGPVSLNQGGESGLVAVVGEALEQLTVAKTVGSFGRCQLAEVAEQNGCLGLGHGGSSPEEAGHFLY
jgi:hypothetical protein